MAVANTRHFQHSLLVLLLQVVVRCYAQCGQHSCPESCGGISCCFSMYEETEIGTVVGNVNVEPELNITLMNIDADGFSITHTGDNDTFELNTSTGEVRLRRVVDRENTSSVCLILDLEYTAAGTVGSALASVGVVVLDINDNSPVFIREPDVLEVEEERSFTHCIGTDIPEAQDADAGSNANITYSLAGDAASKFTIDDENCIRNVVGLDREEVPDSSNTEFYVLSLILIASDGANDSQATLTFNVSDINDNDPQFTADSLEILTILENETNGNVIRDLNATDADYDNKLTYTLDPNANVPFSLNATTGLLSVDTSKIPNRILSLKGYNLEVRVCDSLPDDSSSRCNVTTLHIVVRDVNTPANISKFVQVNDLVEERDPAEYQISYRIDDVDVNDMYLVELSGAFTENFTATVQNRFTAIRLSYPVDQEALIEETKSSIITLMIKVTEVSFFNITQHLECNIPVIGINDNLPFLNETEFELEEETDQGIAADLVGLDLDSGVNGTVDLYCVHSAVAYPGPPDTMPLDLTRNFINVDGCGKKTLIAPKLDREGGIDFVIVTMNITDGGNRSNLVNVTIRLKDINDNYPAFPDEDYRFIFQEGQPPGPIGPAVMATDADSGDNATIKYVLLNYLDLFSVNDTTGVVSTREVVDREEKDSYIIRIGAVNVAVMAASADTSNLKNETSVVLTVGDVNDSPPKWDGVLTMYTIYTTHEVGQTVYTLMATDADLDAKITYTIEDNPLFNISRTGVLIVAASLEEKIGNYSLLVTASDGQHSTPQNITIKVEMPMSTSSPSAVIYGSIGGVISLICFIVLVMFIVLAFVFYDKRRQSVKLSKRNGRLDIDGISSPTRGILRHIPSASSGTTSRSSSANGNGRGVKFDAKVQKIGYDYEHAVNNTDVYFTESSIHLDSSGDESPVTPPRLPTTSHYHNGKLPSSADHPHLSNGAPRLPPIQENFLYSHQRSHPMQDVAYYEEDSDGNSDDDSTLPDNASSTNAPLPSVRHLSHHMAPSPHATPTSPHLECLPPMAQMSPPHQFPRSPEHSTGHTPPHHDELSIRSSSSESLTVTPPPVHNHMSHENQHMSRKSSRNAYPTHMPEAYVTPTSSAAAAARYSADPFMGRYGDDNDFGDASTCASTLLDEALHFHDQEPGIYSLTATSSYDEVSQL